MVATTSLAALALATGIVVSTQIAQASDDEVRPAPTPGAYAENLPPYQTLGNGKTAGLWRPETPVKDRPDYMPVTLKDKVEGYVLRADIPDVFIPLERQTGTHAVTAGDEDALRAETARMEARADSNGDVYATVYGKDGTTKVGEILVDQVR
jgi:hypothetical protein